MICPTHLAELWKRFKSRSPRSCIFQEIGGISRLPRGVRQNYDLCSQFPGPLSGNSVAVTAWESLWTARLRSSRLLGGNACLLLQTLAWALDRRTAHTTHAHYAVPHKGQLPKRPTTPTLDYIKSWLLSVAWQPLLGRGLQWESLVSGEEVLRDVFDAPGFLIKVWGPGGCYWETPHYAPQKCLTSLGFCSCLSPKATHSLLLFWGWPNFTQPLKLATSFFHPSPSFKPSSALLSCPQATSNISPPQSLS